MRDFKVKAAEVLGDKLVKMGGYPGLCLVLIYDEPTYPLELIMEDME